jgi:hypothetical protein
MDGNVWRPAHLTPEQMEERRLAAATLFREGRLSRQSSPDSWGDAVPLSPVGPPCWPSRAGAACKRDQLPDDHRGSMRRPGAG